MIALYILLGLAALIIILLMSDVIITVESGDELSVKARFLFYKRILLPDQDKKKKKKGILLLNIDRSDKESKADGNIKKLIEQRGLLGAVKELLDATLSLVRQVLKAAKHLRVKRFDLLVVAASDDPAKTAVEYGALCGVIFPALSGLQSLVKWNNNKTNVSVRSDFCSDKPVLKLRAKCRIKLWYYVKAMLGLYWDLFKKKYNEIKSNSAKAHR